MYKINRWKTKPGILQIISGTVLIGLPTIPIVASATPYPALNSCPSIYYEEPYNSNIRVPQGCPPNAAMQRLSQQAGFGRRGDVFIPPTQRQPGPPLPELTENPIATVRIVEGLVDVKLKNDTNARISYQAIGHTEPRIIAGGEEVILQNLPTPITVTLVRDDGGLLKIIPRSTAVGMLAVSLDETLNFDSNQGVLRIQRDGEVFLN
ncbi:MAG TPA: hypothetical protein DDW76_23475 [Cyanobacteria bacterium UBA11369]|nr:hypothetical protein [Cyanobacteria bacterium UBA11371]HBE35749.1 hypothetical protein [Cyanobacteria bacterium UBA11368]HBE51654.1 hypothetical protein [Cyanobacteria bacterium UBA11369]